MSGTQKALREALEAIQTHVPPQLRPMFILVGGFALHLHGMDRATQDLDFFITAESLNEWEIAAADDTRFTLHVDMQWSYNCSGAEIEDVTVYIDFIDATTLFYLESVVGASIGGNILVATLEELAVLKAEALVGRMELRDAMDLLWILQKTDTSKEPFNRLSIQQLFGEVREVIEDIDMNKGQQAALRKLLDMFVPSS
jgi:predicted nucleotidyltransferase